MVQSALVTRDLWNSHGQPLLLSKAPHVSTVKLPWRWNPEGWSLHPISEPRKTALQTNWDCFFFSLTSYRFSRSRKRNKQQIPKINSPKVFEYVLADIFWSTVSITRGTVQTLYQQLSSGLSTSSIYRSIIMSWISQKTGIRRLWASLLLVTVLTHSFSPEIHMTFFHQMDWT